MRSLGFSSCERIRGGEAISASKMTFEVPIEEGEELGAKIIATFFRVVKLLKTLD